MNVQLVVDILQMELNGRVREREPSRDLLPYHGTPVSLPGTVEAEDYDNGGQDVAYNDADPGNTGGAYRSDDVDIENCTDAGGGYSVGWTIAGEWMKYSVDVSTAGGYELTARVARGTGGSGAFHIEVNDVPVTGTITVNDTGGWQNWVDVTANLTLSSGVQTIKLVIEAGDVNINYISFASTGQSNGSPYFTSDPVIKANAAEDTAYTGQTLAGDATDPEADPLSFSRVAGPSWLNVAADGALSGTPGDADPGLNSWMVQVSDGNNSPVTAMLEITVDNVNDAPVFTADPINKSDAQEDAAYSDSLGGSAFDVDAGDTLTYSKVSGPAWLNIAADGALSGTPGAGDVGANVFTVKVEDAALVSDTATLNITVTAAPVNQPPAFTADPINKANGTENVAYSGSIAGDAADPESDPMTFSKVSGPAWLNVAANGALSGTPGAGDVGANVFTVQVDATGGSDTATLNITVDVIGGGPTDDYANADIIASGTVSGSYVDTQASDNGYQFITEVESGGKPSNRHTLLEHKWTVNVTGGDSVTFYVEAYRTANSEGDDFVFAYSTDNANFTDMVTVTKTADDNTAQSYALPASLSGTVYIRVTDTDRSSGNRALDTVFIDEMYIRSDGTPPPNQAPSFNSDPVVEVNATEASSYSASIADNASDPESDPMTFSKVSGPAWLSVAANGALSGTPGTGDVGLNNFTVQVDAIGGSDTAILEITVDAVGTVTDIYIADIAMTSASYGGKRYTGIATITVRDEFGATVSGASVSVDWSGATSSSASGTTDGSGVVVFESGRVRNGGTYSVTVSGVTASGYNYNPALNVETSDSITAP